MAEEPAEPFRSPMTDAIRRRIAEAEVEGRRLAAQQPHVPTIAEVEAEVRRPTPEQRAEQPRPTSRAFYRPQEDITTATDPLLMQMQREQPDSMQRLQELVQRMPVVRWFGQETEPIGAAFARLQQGDVVPVAIVRRMLYDSVEGGAARASVYKWLAESRELLGIDGKGFARAVPLKEGVKKPQKATQRLDDILERPQDYIRTAEQQQAILAGARYLQRSL